MDLEEVVEEQPTHQGNTPPVTPAQGTDDRSSAKSNPDSQNQAGGGGATAGQSTPKNHNTGGEGGAGGGVTGFGSNGVCSTGVQYYAGGGGGATGSPR